MLIDDVSPEQVQTLQQTPIRAVFRFDWTKPPLHLNQRGLNAQYKAKVIRSLRFDASARAQELPPLGRCEAQLIWVVTTKRRRDEENITPTLKALCDGLVDAGVVEDDTPEFMEKPMPQIVYSKEYGPAHFLLVVTQLFEPWVPPMLATYLTDGTISLEVPVAAP